MSGPFISEPNNNKNSHKNTHTTRKMARWRDKKDGPIKITLKYSADQTYEPTSDISPMNLIVIVSISADLFARLLIVTSMINWLES